MPFTDLELQTQDLTFDQQRRQAEDVFRHMMQSPLLKLCANKDRWVLVRYRIMIIECISISKNCFSASIESAFVCFGRHCKPALQPTVRGTGGIKSNDVTQKHLARVVGQALSKCST